MQIAADLHFCSFNIKVIDSFFLFVWYFFLHGTLLCHVLLSAIYISTDVSGSSCFFSSFARCRLWYLLFWNQFLIWSSVISRPLANNVRSSRVRYCWRENILSRYWSWRWVKWLRFRLFRFGPFSLKHLTDFGSWMNSLSLTPSENVKRKYN